MLLTRYQNPVNVFLSYAHEDESLLKELMKHLSLLKQQGLVSTWYDRQIVSGTNWAATIDEQLDLASIILLLVSPDFLASDYCYQIEMKRAIARHEAGSVRVIPLLMRPTDWKDAPFAHLQALPTDMRPITTWTNQDEAFVDVVAGIRRAVEDLPLLPTSASRAALPAIWTIPHPPNPFFLGRDDILSHLHMHLQAGQVTALSQPPHAIGGLGGIGKTQIAVEYAYRYHQEYEAVLWAYAESEDALISSYDRIATLLKLPEREAQEQGIIIQAVKEWLQSHRKWLLILDNADDLDLLPPFLPTIASGHLLLTTRAWDMQRLATRLEVEMLSEEQGALLLLRRAGLLAPHNSLEQAVPKERTWAVQLTQELGGLPLALDQAGAYLEATGMSIDEYYRIYQQHRRTLLHERRSRLSDHPDAVATTWSLSFERVEEKNPAAVNLLQFCAFVAADGIPEEIMTQGAEHLGPLLEPLAADGFLLAQAVEALRAYSLVSRNPRTRTLSVHRLVQAVLRDSMSDEAGQQWKQRAVQAVYAALPDTKFEQWSACDRCLPHALVCATWIEHERMTHLEAGHLLDWTAFYLHIRGRYTEAEPLYQRALAIYEQQLGAEHPSAAHCLNNLAELYEFLGKNEQAEPLHERALAIYEQALGPMHSNTANSINNLAEVYHSRGKYAEAEPLFQRALAIYEQMFGAEYPFLARILHSLANLYRAQGKYEQAEPLYQRAISIRVQQVSTEHPDMADSLHSLASLYQSQGKYDQAEPLYQRAIVIQEQRLGAQHPHTVSILHGLATLYRAQSKHERAEPLLKQVLFHYEQRLGAQHPHTQSIREDYVALLRTISHYSEAKKLEEES